MAFADIVKRAAAASAAGNNALNSGASTEEARASVLNAMRNTRPASVPKGSLLSQMQQRAQQSAQASKTPAVAPYGSSTFSQFNNAENAPKKSEESEAKTKASDASAVEGFFDTDEQANAPKQSSNFEDLLRSLGILPQQAFADTGESTFVPSEKYTTSSGKMNAPTSDNYVADPWALAAPTQTPDKGVTDNKQADSRMDDQIFTSNPQELAMPSGEQIANLSPEEREYWQNLTETGLAGTTALALAPLSGFLGAGAGATVPAIASLGGMLWNGSEAEDAQGKVEQQEEAKKAANRPSLGKFNQAQSFYDWEDLDALSEKYGYDFSEANNGYSAFRNLALDNPELLADVFGYGDFTEIPGWRSLYARSGVDLSDDATAVDNLSRYYNDNAANLYEWIANNDDSRMGNTEQALADAARWYYANYGDPQYGVFDPMQYGNWGLNGGEFDADDFAQFALLSRLTNEQDPTRDLSLNQINDIFGRAGEGYTFGLTPEGYLGLSDGNGGFYYDEGRSSGDNARQYSMQEFMNPVIATTPYMAQANPLMDQYAIDSLLTAYNKTVDQKKAAKQ